MNAAKYLVSMKFPTMIDLRDFESYAELKDHEVDEEKMYITAPLTIQEIEFAKSAFHGQIAKVFQQS